MPIPPVEVCFHFKQNKYTEVEGKICFVTNVIVTFTDNIACSSFLSEPEKHEKSRNE